MQNIKHIDTFFVGKLLTINELIVLKLIMNADDFGYSEGINYRIIEAYQCGIVR